jgi:hypothetical protein
MEMWAYGQSIVGHRRTSYRECPTVQRSVFSNVAVVSPEKAKESLQGKSLLPPHSRPS